jgi:hypothetical protein
MFHRCGQGERHPHPYPHRQLARTTLTTRTTHTGLGRVRPGSQIGPTDPMAHRVA